MKKWFIVTGILLALLAAGLVGCSPVSNAALGGLQGLNLASQQEGIWVNGQGQVPAIPDIATISLGIESQSANVSDAQSQASGAMDSVMKALKANGVADKDIQTQYFNIQRVTRWDDKNQQEVVTGYRVTNTVVVKIRKMDTIGTVIDAVAVAGGDLTRVNGIGFSVDDPTPYYKAAREKAIADASAKATQLASLSGITLGKPTYISENTYTPAPVPVYAARDMAAGSAAKVATPISTGETTVSVNVQVVYSIK